MYLGEEYRCSRFYLEMGVGKGIDDIGFGRRDQRHTLIVAPIGSMVGNRQAQAGDHVQPGARLLTSAPLHALCVLAYFKETQTNRMTTGQETIVEVDAFSSRKGNEQRGRPYDEFGGVRG